MDCPYEEDLIEHMRNEGEVRTTSIARSFSVLRFKKANNVEDSTTSICERFNVVFLKLHELDWDTLEKVEVLFVFKGVVSEEMKKELANRPTYEYVLDKKDRILSFNSGDGLLRIAFSRKTTKRSQEQDDDEAPPPKRMRTSERNPDSSGESSNQHVEEENMEDRGINRRGGINHDALPNAQPDELKEQEEEQETQGIEEEGEKDIKPAPALRQIFVARRQLEEAKAHQNAQLDSLDAPHSDRTPTRTIKQEPDHPIEQSPRTSETASTSASTSASTPPSICALQLAQGIAALSYSCKSTEWYNKATERINALTEKELKVPLNEFSWALQFVLNSIHEARVFGFRVGAIPMREFLKVLQSSVVFPFGVELMRAELEMINLELDEFDKIEADAAMNGDIVESFRIPKETIDMIIRHLLRLTSD